MLFSLRQPARKLPATDKLYELTELKRGDCFCLNAVLGNSPIQYTIVSTVSSEVLQLERMHILKYEK